MAGKGRKGWEFTQDLIESIRIKIIAAKAYSYTQYKKLQKNRDDLPENRTLLSHFQTNWRGVIAKLGIIPPLRMTKELLFSKYIACKLELEREPSLKKFCRYARINERVVYRFFESYSDLKNSAS